MAVTLSTLAAEQSKGTQATARAVTKFLNYAATNTDASICYTPSDMILRAHSDTSYLSEPQARSRVGGHFYLGTADEASHNGPILNPTGVIKVVVSSAAEAETAGLFTNMKEAVILRTTLKEMGHPQPPTPIQVDNSTAAGIANNHIKQQRSKAIDMRFYWVRDCIDQNQFHVFWRPGSENLADYFTKHHTATHHQRMRSQYLHMKNRLHLLQQTPTTHKTSDRTHCEGVLIPKPITLGIIATVRTDHYRQHTSNTKTVAQTNAHARTGALSSHSQAHQYRKPIF